MSFNPRVSIIIPVFNGSNYLDQAINSALSQTYKNIEVIVVNDGSTDEGKTREIALSYGDKIRYFEKENGGVATALNLGIEKMAGDYFSWLSHDDLYCNNKVESQIHLLKKLENKLTVIYAGYEIVDKDNNLLNTVLMPEIPPSDFRLWLTIINVLHGCTLLVPVECFHTHGLFDESLLTTQDYDLWFRLAGDYEFANVPEILVKSRLHNEQSTRQMSSIVVEECNLLLLNFFNELNNLDKEKGRIIGESFYQRQFFLASYIVYSELFKAESWTSIKGKVNYMNKIIKSYFKILKSHRFLLKYIRKSRVDNRKRFTSYYKLNSFNSEESRSGEGSTLKQTEIIREKLPEVFIEYNIKTFIDAPCGDLNWMRYVDISAINKYYGIDIVQKIISNNQKKYKDEKKDFICLDIINDKLPGGDIILCRDCLVHLSFRDGIKAIRNFKDSGIKYLLTTTFTNRTINRDLALKDIWRPLNMQLPPFNFPDPLLIINEGCTEDNCNYTDKCLALYKLDSIKLSL